MPGTVAPNDANNWRLPRQSSRLPFSHWAPSREVVARIRRARRPKELEALVIPQMPVEWAAKRVQAVPVPRADKVVEWIVHRPKFAHSNVALRIKIAFKAHASRNAPHRKLVAAKT